MDGSFGGGSARRPPGSGSDAGTGMVSLVTTASGGTLDGGTRGANRGLVESIRVKYEARFFSRFFFFFDLNDLWICAHW